MNGILAAVLRRPARISRDDRRPDTLDDLIGRLERAAEQLRSGELTTDAAATLVEDCAALAAEAGAELDRRARAAARSRCRARTRCSRARPRPAALGPPRGTALELRRPASAASAAQSLRRRGAAASVRQLAGAQLGGALEAADEVGPGRCWGRGGVEGFDGVLFGRTRPPGSRPRRTPPVEQRGSVLTTSSMAPSGGI